MGQYLNDLPLGWVRLDHKNLPGRSVSSPSRYNSIGDIVGWRASKTARSGLNVGWRASNTARPGLNLWRPGPNNPGNACPITRHPTNYRPEKTYDGLSWDGCIYPWWRHQMETFSPLLARARHFPLPDGPGQVKLQVGQVDLNRFFLFISYKQMEELQISRSRASDDFEKRQALLALCEGNQPVTGGFPSQRPVTRSFEVFFDVRLNKRLNKQSRCRWFERPLCSLWRHCKDYVFVPCKSTPWNAFNSSWSSEFVALWGQTATQIWVNIVSGYSLLPDCTKPLLEPMLTCHRRCSMVFTWTISKVFTNLILNMSSDVTF